MPFVTFSQTESIIICSLFNVSGWRYTYIHTHRNMRTYAVALKQQNKRDTCAHGSRTRTAKEFHFWFAQCATKGCQTRWATSIQLEGMQRGMKRVGREGGRMRRVKVNKPPVGVKGSSEACGEKIAFHLDTHGERVRHYREGRGFNKKFESGSRDFADDRPGLGDRRKSGEEGGWGSSSSQSIWEEAREGRLPSRAEYRVILPATSAKSLHDDKRIPTGLGSAP